MSKESILYKCKDCNYRYTVTKKSDVKPIEVRRMALEMYLEGLGFRSIGRLLKTSHVTVYYWVKHWGENSRPSIKKRASRNRGTRRDAHLYRAKKLLLDMDCC